MLTGERASLWERERCSARYLERSEEEAKASIGALGEGAAGAGTQGLTRAQRYTFLPRLFSGSGSIILCTFRTAIVISAAVTAVTTTERLRRNRA